PWAPPITADSPVSGGERMNAASSLWRSQRMRFSQGVPRENGPDRDSRPGRSAPAAAPRPPERQLPTFLEASPAALAADLAVSFAAPAAERALRTVDLADASSSWVAFWRSTRLTIRLPRSASPS